jgi:hypothetical protein
VVSTTPKEREPSTRAPHEEVDTVSRHPWGRDSSFRPLGQGPMNGPGEGARRSAPQGGAHRSALICSLWMNVVYTPERIVLILVLERQVALRLLWARALAGL